MTSFGLQEWSPERAGKAAKSIQVGFTPWSPAESGSQVVGGRTGRAFFQRVSRAARAAGESRALASVAMSL